MNEGTKLVYQSIQKLEKARLLLGDPIDIVLAVGCLHNLLRLLANGPADASGVHGADNKEAPKSKGQRVKREPGNSDAAQFGHYHD